MLLAFAIVSALLALNFLALYRRGMRERLALGEYMQFLLMTPELYADHRTKFLEFVKSTANQTPDQRGAAAQRVIANMANSLFDKVLLSNVAARNQIVAATANQNASGPPEVVSPDEPLV